MIVSGTVPSPPVQGVTVQDSVDVSPPTGFTVVGQNSRWTASPSPNFATVNAGVLASTYNLDWDLAGLTILTLTASNTLTLTFATTATAALPSASQVSSPGQGQITRVEFTGAQGASITWPSTITWLSGQAPSYTNTNPTLVELTCTGAGLSPTFIGTYSTYGATSGSTDPGSISLGINALVNQSTGTWNVALGQNALSSLVNGQANVAVGWDAGYNIIAGVGNIAIGYKAAFQNTSGSANISIGQNVHSTLATGSNNVAVGYYAGAAVSTISNTTFIGSLAGRYETAANSIMIDSIERTNLAGGRAGAPFYAVTNATVANQTVQLNGVVSIPTLPVTFGTNKMTWAAAAPSTGTWAVGDIIWNTGVTASTSPGWVCTTPGAAPATAVFTAMPVL